MVGHIRKIENGFLVPLYNSSYVLFVDLCSFDNCIFIDTDEEKGVLDIIINENKSYTLNHYTNTLWVHDLERKQVVNTRKICKESDDSEEYLKLFLYNGRIYIIPRKGRYIAKYSIATDTLSHIEIPSAEFIVVNAELVIDNKVLMIINWPMRYLLFDLAKEEITWMLVQGNASDVGCDYKEKEKMDLLAFISLVGDR